MKKASPLQSKQSGKVNLSSFMYYTVLSLAALAGIMAYSAGASAEAALLRAVIVLLVCTILGYALNIALWLSTPTQMAATVIEGMAGRERVIDAEDVKHLSAGESRGTAQASEEPIPLSQEHVLATEPAASDR
jgi:hypothetical protein